MFNLHRNTLFSAFYTQIFKQGYAQVHGNPTFFSFLRGGGGRAVSLCTHGFFLLVYTINFGWSIVCIDGSKIIISNKYVFLSLKIVFV